MLVGPDVSRLGMNCEALRIPVPVAPDLRPGVGAVDKRIVGGNAAVVMESIDGTVMVGDILGGVSLQISAGRHLSFSDRDEKEAVTVEGESRTVMSATSRHRLENLFYIREAIVLEPTAHHRRGCLRTIGVWLGETQVEKAVRGEIRMRYHIQKSALPLGEYLGNPGYRIGEEPPVPNNAESSGALGYQHFAPGKKRNGPGVNEPVCHCDYAVVVVRRPVDLRLARCGGRNGQE